MKKSLNRLIQTLADILVGIGTFHIMEKIPNTPICLSILIAIIVTAVFAEYLEISKKPE